MYGKLLMHQRPTSRFARGFSLMEVMVGLSIGLIVAFGAGTMLTASAKTIGQQDMLAAAEQDAQVLLRMISAIVMQSEAVGLTYPGGITNPNPAGTLAQSGDGWTFIALLPAGYKIWPNDTAPYTQRAVQMVWSAQTGGLTLANAADISGLSAAAPQQMAIVSEKTARIVNIDVWPLKIDGTRQSAASDMPDGGYEICVTTRASQPDSGYMNPDDGGTLQHYRTANTCGVALARNL